MRKKKKDNRHTHSTKAARRSLEKHSKGKEKHHSPSEGNTLGEFDIKVLGMFHRNPHSVYNVRQLTARMELPQTMQEKVSASINHLLAVGQVEECETGRYKAAPTTQYIVGTMDFTASGAAYLIPDDKERFTDDIYIPSHSTAQSLHGDKVRVYVFKRKSGRRPEGEVVEIITRAKEHFVGRIEISGNYGFVIPDNNRIHVNFYIPREGFKDAKNGDKVIVEIASWPEKAAGPVGRITEVLGTPGEHDVEIHSILAEYGLPYHFDEAVEKEAENLPIEISDEEIARRRDMRSATTFTIDPADAKDFDDALSFRVLDNGNVEVGVHIADVTHYVQEGSMVEQEARERATSVYLVDRTIPMLPERLSNGLCSLRPDEEKLCFSAIFEMDSEARVVGSWFGRTVILSNRRFTYEEAQRIIEGEEGDFRSEILALNALAQKMRHRRFEEGSIAFEREEAKFHLDSEGKPLGVYFKVQKEANQLIEEFMLLANRSVSEFIGSKKGKNGKPKTFVYRVHEKPDEDKLARFANFILRFGYYFDARRGRVVAQQMNALMGEIKGKSEENVVSILAVRTMQKAYYSTENKGHYGLAFPYYSHFTSPIRRYPDMMLHRLLAHYLEGGSSVDAEVVEELCEHSSDQETRAAEAERASVKYKMVEFMRERVGEEFDGSISGVTEWGLYVELEDTHIEGMVALRDLSDEFYAFDEEEYAAVGTRSGRKFTLGDRVRVRVKNADLRLKQLDFEMVGSYDGKGELWRINDRPTAPANPKSKSRTTPSADTPFYKGIKRRR